MTKQEKIDRLLDIAEAMEWLQNNGFDDYPEDIENIRCFAVLVCQDVEEGKR